MAPRWQPGESYNYGDVVEFEGCEYKIIQPHRSQGDWTPPVTPALWGRAEGGHHRHHHGERGGEDYHTPPGYGQQQRYEVDQKSYQAPSEQLVPEQKKTWVQEHEKELKIGGGILAGAAALGAGIFAYNEYKEHTEEKQGHAWSANRWEEEAQARTQQLKTGRHQAPVAWIWNEGKSIPSNAIQGGEERGEILYICRVYHEGGLYVGKASSVFKKGAVIGYKKDEYHYDKYEILVGDARAIRWVSCYGQFNLEALGGARPVEGGKEPNGAPIYIAQAPHNGAVHPGKACEEYGDGCFIPYDDSEKKVKEYAVLCYA